jgi:hypothetical protein
LKLKIEGYKVQRFCLRVLGTVSVQFGSCVMAVINRGGQLSVFCIVEQLPLIALMQPSFAWVFIFERVTSQI